ncbi:MAG: alpha-glucosidase/alpha-galactosidase, partial [Actinomycetales bacterium]|nr:alpha-glucosidase/alpha-galactosidase [Actinomycetales bacterium]
MVTIAFIGAGSVVFTRQLLADLFSYSDLPQLTISLHDINAERLEVATGIATQLSQQWAA